MTDWSPYAQQRYWVSEEAQQRYWGLDHLNEVCEPTEDGYRRPVLDILGLVEPAELLAPENARYVRRFASHWRRWHGETTLDQRLAAGRHALPEARYDVYDPTSHASAITVYMVHPRVAKRPR